jgi:putative spermidine/putrescine transport system substrate-binding protein
VKHPRSAPAIVVASGAALAMALAGCSSSSSPSASSGSSPANQHVTLTMVTDSDTNIATMWDKTLIPAFEKAYPNITLKLETSNSGDETALYARIAASVRAHAAPPVDVFVDSEFIPEASAAGLLYPVSASNVPNFANIISVDAGTAGEMAYRGSAVVVAYNSKKVSNPPTTLAGVLAWVKAHPGQFSYNNPSDGGSGQGFVQAVLDQSLSSSTVTNLANSEDTADQSQWSAGWSTLKSLNPDIYQHTYPTGNTPVLNLLAQGQIELAPVWSDQFLAAIQQGAMPSYIHAVSITSPAMPGGPAFLGIPKNAPDIPDILKLFNWMLEPAQQAQIVTQVSGYPAITQTLLPAAVQSAFGQLNTADEAPFYSADASADMDNEWTRDVP